MAESHIPEHAGNAPGTSAPAPTSPPACASLAPASPACPLPACAPLPHPSLASPPPMRPPITRGKDARGATARSGESPQRHGQTRQSLSWRQDRPRAALTRHLSNISRALTNQGAQVSFAAPLALFLEPHHELAALAPAAASPTTLAGYDVSLATARATQIADGRATLRAPRRGRGSSPLRRMGWRSRLTISSNRIGSPPLSAREVTVFAARHLPAASLA